MKNLSLILLLLIFSNLAHSQSPTAASKWKKYFSPDKSFEVSYPENWEFNPKAGMGTIFVILSGRENDSDDFADNVNLIIQPLNGMDMTSEEFGISGKPFLRKMVTDYKEIDSKVVKLASREAYMILYTGKQGQYSLKYNQLFFVEKGKGYVFTYTCKPESFNNFIKTFIGITNSFVIK